MGRMQECARVFCVFGGAFPSPRVAVAYHHAVWPAPAICRDNRLAMLPADLSRMIEQENGPVRVHQRSGVPIPVPDETAAAGQLQ